MEKKEKAEKTTETLPPNNQLDGSVSVFRIKVNTLDLPGKYRKPRDINALELKVYHWEPPFSSS